MRLFLVKDKGRTDPVRNCIAGISCLEDEDGGIRVLGETRRDRKACGASADNDKVVCARDLAVVDDVPLSEVAVGVEVVVRARMGECTLGERGGQQKEAEGPHRGEEGGRK